MLEGMTVMQYQEWLAFFRIGNGGEQKDGGKTTPPPVEPASLLSKARSIFSGIREKQKAQQDGQFRRKKRR